MRRLPGMRSLRVQHRIGIIIIHRIDLIPVPEEVLRIELHLPGQIHRDRIPLVAVEEIQLRHHHKGIINRLSAIILIDLILLPEIVRPTGPILHLRETIQVRAHPGITIVLLLEARVLPGVFRGQILQEAGHFLRLPEEEAEAILLREVEAADHVHLDKPTKQYV